MNRPDLFRAVEFAHAAAMNATLAASFDKINPTKAAEYRRLSEDAFNAGIEALFEADLTFPPLNLNRRKLRNAHPFQDRCDACLRLVCRLRGLRGIDYRVEGRA